MNKLRPYLVIAIALLLATGPWLKSAEVKASSEKAACDCCQGQCKGCCCSMPSAPKKATPANEKDGCRCELSQLPAMPFEINEHRLSAKSAKAEIEPPPFVQPGVDPNLCDHTLDKSPPPVAFRPAYVLFSALLI